MSSKTGTSQAAGLGSKGQKRRALLWFSLNFKFSLVTTMVLGGLMAVVTGFVYHQTSQALGREVRERGATTARNLAANASEAMLPLNDVALAILVKESVQPLGSEAVEEQSDFFQQAWADLAGAQSVPIKNQGMVEALVCDATGTIVAHSENSATIGRPWQKPAYLALGNATGEPPIYLRDGHQVYDIEVPVMHKLTQMRMGTVHLALRKDTIDRQVRILSTRIAAITLAMLAFSVLVTLLLVRALVRPVDHLVQGVRAIGKGDFSMRLKAGSRDELGDLGRAYNAMAKSLGENAALRSAFSRYTSASLMQDILADPTKMAKLGGNRLPATMFFSMVHGLSEISETMEAEAFVDIINEYLSVQTEVIAKHEGHIDKFVREEVMAVFGVPEPRPDDALRAVAAAVDCQLALGKLNQKRRRDGKAAFGVSIGVNTGEVVAGNMGSQQKMDYTVIGDAVNTSARLMASGKEGQVLISSATYDLIKDRLEVQELEPIRVKGKKEPLKIWHVVRVKRG